jgi:hypothetical protein
VSPSEEFVVGLVEADFITAKIAKDLDAYLLSIDSDYYIIGGLE